MGVKNSKTNKNGEVTMEDLTNTTTKGTTENKSKQNNGKKKDNDNDRDPYYGGDSDNDFQGSEIS